MEIKLIHKNGFDYNQICTECGNPIISTLYRIGTKQGEIILCKEHMEELVGLIGRI